MSSYRACVYTWRALSAVSYVNVRCTRRPYTQHLCTAPHSTARRQPVYCTAAQRRKLV